MAYNSKIRHFKAILYAGNRCGKCMDFVRIPLTAMNTNIFYSNVTVLNPLQGIQ